MAQPFVKRPRLTARLPPPSPDVFDKFVDDFLAVYIMQFLESLEGLHFAKTCKRFTQLYQQKRDKLRRFKKYSNLFILFDPSCENDQALTLEITNSASFLKLDFNLVLFDKKSVNEHVVDFIVSRDSTSVSVSISRDQEWKERPLHSNAMEWTCIIEKGTHSEAFVLLASFVAERFAFETIIVKGMADQALSGTLSKILPKVDVLKVENAVNLNEKDIVNWSRISLKYYKFKSVTPISLSKTFFDDVAISRRNFNVFECDDKTAVCDFTSDHLRLFMANEMSIRLSTAATSVTLEDIRKLISNWAKNEPEVLDVLLPIQLDRDNDAEILHKDLEREDHNIVDVLVGRLRQGEQKIHFKVLHKTVTSRSLSVEIDVQRRGGVAIIWLSEL